MLRAAGIEVNLLTQPEALNCIAGYSCRVSDNRPFVRIKTGSSIDGGTALASGESQWITGEASRADVQYWRARSDAIVTGVGTVLADDPRLTVRPDVHNGAYADCLQPLRVVLDSKLRTPPTSTLLSDGGATLLVHNADVTPPAYLGDFAQVTLLGLDNGPHDLAALLTHLAEIGCNEVLVEAGAQVCGSFAAAGLWDEWLCYVAPKWMGSGHRGLADLTVPHLADAPTGEILQITEIGDDMRLRMVPERG